MNKLFKGILQGTSENWALSDWMIFVIIAPFACTLLSIWMLIYFIGMITGVVEGDDYDA